MSHQATPPPIDVLFSGTGRDVLPTIVKYLSFKDRKGCSMVSKAWRDAFAPFIFARTKLNLSEMSKLPVPAIVCQHAQFLEIEEHGQDSRRDDPGESSLAPSGTLVASLASVLADCHGLGTISLDTKLPDNASLRHEKAAYMRLLDEIFGTIRSIHPNAFLKVMMSPSFGSGMIVNAVQPLYSGKYRIDRLKLSRCALAPASLLAICTMKGLNTLVLDHCTIPGLPPYQSIQVAFSHLSVLRLFGSTAYDFFELVSAMDFKNLKVLDIDSDLDWEGGWCRTTTVPCIPRPPLLQELSCSAKSAKALLQAGCGEQLQVLRLFEDPACQLHAPKQRDLDAIRRALPSAQIAIEYVDAGRCRKPPRCRCIGGPHSHPHPQ